MADLFKRFKDLASTQVEGIDYKRLYRSGRSGILIMAPHGGGIEFMTAPLAEGIAGKEHSLYCFKGCKEGGGNGCLHITSTNFDEPIALEAVTSHRLVLAIHGARETDAAWVMVGGLASEVRDMVSTALETAGFTVEPCDATRAANSPDNICNRSGGRGVQLELSAALRQSFREDAEQKTTFVQAVRMVLDGLAVESVNKAQER